MNQMKKMTTRLDTFYQSELLWDLIKAFCGIISLVEFHMEYPTIILQNEHHTKIPELKINNWEKVTNNEVDDDDDEDEDDDQKLLRTIRRNEGDDDDDDEDENDDQKKLFGD